MEAETSENKDIDVSDDFLLLEDIRDEYGITVKKLALETGRAGSTVHRYCNGGATIPSNIWRALYRLTGDGRIIKLFLGDIPHVVVPLPDEPLEINEATIKRLLEMRQRQIDCEGAAMIQSQYQTFLAISVVKSKKRRPLPSARV